MSGIVPLGSDQNSLLGLLPSNIHPEAAVHTGVALVVSILLVNTNSTWFLKTSLKSDTCSIRATNPFRRLGHVGIE